MTTTSATNSETFTNFINRDEGHYILNLDKSTLANNENQGITNIYIAPPGELTTGTTPGVWLFDDNYGTLNVIMLN